MKKKVLSLIAILTFTLLPFAVKAQDSYFNAGENITSTGEYNHSYFEAGNNIKSNAKVNGISFIAGNSIDVKGKSEYAFVAGESLDIEGEIEKDLFAAGNNIKINKDASILRDAYIGGNNVKIATNINGNLYVGGTIVELDNITINGDVHIACNTLNIIDNVTVNGNVYINEDALINNEDKLSYVQIDKYSTHNNIEFKNKISDKIISILSTIFTGIILAIVLSKVFKKINYDISLEDVCKKSLIGLAALILVPMITILSFAVMVGFSIGVIIILLYVISLMIATIFTSTIVGHNIYTKLLKQKENVYASIVIGVIILNIVELIPVVGGVISLLAFLYGLGVIVKLFLELRK